jgi:oxygen-dependent protoporphyrinogen oxidase
LGDRFRLGVKVSELPASTNLVLCVPANAAADLLESSDPQLAGALRGVIYSPLVSVTAFVEKLGFGRAPRGVGVLLPEGTSRKALGVLFNSSSFPNRVLNENTDVSLTLMLGGSEHPDILEENDLKIQSDVRADLEKIFDLAPGARLETVIHRWPRAVPQYNGALQVAWRAAHQGWCSRPGQVSIRGLVELAARLQTTRI